MVALKHSHKLQAAAKRIRRFFQLGQKEEKVKRIAELAKEGFGFLVIYAPSGEETKRVMDIIKPLNPEYAEKYNRLTLEELA